MFVSCYCVCIAIGFVLFAISFVLSFWRSNARCGFIFTSERSSDRLLRVPSMRRTEFNDDFS